jgi:hypothetical protein
MQRMSFPEYDALPKKVLLISPLVSLGRDDKKRIVSFRPGFSEAELEWRNQSGQTQFHGQAVVKDSFLQRMSFPE